MKSYEMNRYFNIYNQHIKENYFQQFHIDLCYSFYENTLCSSQGKYIKI